MSDSGEIVVYRFPKGRKSEVRAVLRTYGGRRLAELRGFVRVQKVEGFEGGQVYHERWVPTRRGLAVEWGQVGELLEAAQALAAEVARQQAATASGDARVDVDAHGRGDDADGRAHGDASDAREIM